MEFFLTLATTYLLTFPALIVLVLLGIFLESNDNSSGVFIGAIAAVVAYFMFSVSIQTLVLIGIAYIIIGSIWSFYRYKQFVDDSVNTFLTNNKVLASFTELQTRMHVLNKDALIRNISPKAKLGRITSWIIIWPFSVVENITGDIVRMVKKLVSETLKSVYNKIYNGAIAKLNSTGE